MNRVLALLSTMLIITGSIFSSVRVSTTLRKRYPALKETKKDVELRKRFGQAHPYSPKIKRRPKNELLPPGAIAPRPIPKGATTFQ